MLWTFPSAPRGPWWATGRPTSPRESSTRTASTSSSPRPVISRRRRGRRSPNSACAPRGSRSGKRRVPVDASPGARVAPRGARPGRAGGTKQEICRLLGPRLDCGHRLRCAQRVRFGAGRPGDEVDRNPRRSRTDGDAAGNDFRARENEAPSCPAGGPLGADRDGRSNGSRAYRRTRNATSNA